MVVVVFESFSLGCAIGEQRQTAAGGNISFFQYFLYGGVTRRIRQAYWINWWSVRKFIPSGGLRNYRLYFVGRGGRPTNKQYCSDRFLNIWARRINLFNCQCNIFGSNYNISISFYCRVADKCYCQAKLENAGRQWISSSRFSASLLVFFLCPVNINPQITAVWWRWGAGPGLTR